MKTLFTLDEIIGVINEEEEFDGNPSLGILLYMVLHPVQNARKIVQLDKQNIRERFVRMAREGLDDKR